MTERRHKKAVRSARKCENLLDRQRGGNKNGYKWRKSVRCRLHRGSGEGKPFLRKRLEVLRNKCSNIMVSSLSWRNLGEAFHYIF